MSAVTSSQSSSSSHQTVSVQELKLPPGCYREIPNVHDDDIHALIKIGVDRFASGSKDTTLKIWDANWAEKIKIKRFSKSEHDYRRWITALTPLADKDGSFASGTRDGLISIWTPDGKLRSTTQIRNDGDHVCKDRNKNRINCLRALPVKNDRHVFLAGMPRLLTDFEWDWNNRINRGNTTAIHKNDWVYCIDPLRTTQASENDYLVVIGSDLEVWSKEEHEGVITKWEKKTALIKEDPNEISYKQRPHISHLEYIDAHTVALALFSGKIQLIDLETETTIGLYEKHKRRVWTVVKMADNYFVSGADDGLAILWDFRTADSRVREIGRHYGRVSCLLTLNDSQFVSASCPDDVRNAEQKGTFTFWDVRK